MSTFLIFFGLVFVTGYVSTLVIVHTTGADHHSNQINYPMLYPDNYRNTFRQPPLVWAYNKGWNTLSGAKIVARKERLNARAERNRARLEGNKPVKKVDPNDVIGDM